MRRKRIFLLFFACLFLVLVFWGGLSKKLGERLKTEPHASLILATTTSTQDSGLLDEILPRFERKYDIRVRTIAVGTGEAIALGKRGEADVLLVHSKEEEINFVQEGYGKNRKDVMYNDFIIVGPPSDPAKIEGKDSSEAFRKIADEDVPFISRGDNSGTHKKEKKIWREAGVVPSGDWYLEVGQGMGETLRIADEKQAYTLSDRGTYLAQRKNINLKVLVEKEKILFNPYGVIAVNPQKFPKVNYRDAVRFVNWITSYEVQKVIKNFGREEYGQPLFIPLSDEWKAKTKR